jgi:hypothetical protein
MSDDAVQSYSNHARWLVPWHFFVIPVLIANAVIQVVEAGRTPGVPTAWAAIVAIALLVGMVCARRMSLRVQDRLVCLEESLRLERLMPDRRMDIEQLTREHFIGIRFASDAEVPHLLDRILAGELATRDDVKRAVQHWRPDHLRA